MNSEKDCYIFYEEINRQNAKPDVNKYERAELCKAFFVVTIKKRIDGIEKICEISVRHKGMKIKAL